VLQDICKIIRVGTQQTFFTGTGLRRTKPRQGAFL